MSGRQGSRNADTFKDIAAYFSKEEWADLCDWEKLRYKNMKRNYEAMLTIGLDVPKPEFMARRNRGRQPQLYESSDSEEDWTPKLHTKNAQRARIFRHPFINENSKKVKSVIKVTSHSEKDKREDLGGFTETPNSQKEDVILVKRIKRATAISSRKVLRSTSEKSIQENEKRYNLRNKERKIYTEEQELCDDNYFFCEDCEKFFIEECPVHGPPIFMKDISVEFNHPDRACLTLPEGLRVAMSKIPKAGLGVWNEGKLIPRGIHFGPYEGEISNEEAAVDSGYSWVISQVNNIEYIDAQDESKSNWMRFVNCARKEEEQNLVAFQHRGKIYYRTCKPVHPHCELLVWYGDDYARELGITWTTMWMSSQEPKSVQVQNDCHPCPHCNVTFTTADFLKRHLRRHPEASRQTSTAQTSFAIGNLNLQRKRWQDPFTPPEGRREFVKSGDHQTGTKEREHECSDCGKRFLRAGNLHQHKRIHTGERPYKCSDCGKRFIRAGNLHQHKRIHTGERPYKCSDCGKRFIRAGNLHQHKRIHTGERPYKCSDCGKRFLWAGILHQHKRIHTGERPYKCSDCGKRFLWAGNLHQHKRIHTGERPYKCSDCGKRFLRAGNLHQHKRIHTGERPYKCAACGQSFVYLYQQKAHTCFETCDVCGNKFKDMATFAVHLRGCRQIRSKLY
ncbi:histone-lysine N-methyltransferase PRDM9-like isoform X2 [Narcine bancroftii]|uniref:histone-lysine N-methyltransferase PRDM9-like isoform X2 n=1 Tax=Narcine bancroftii TaxID=1343680 RepID=UPI00383154B6